jgi:hypothetical protein
MRALRAPVAIVVLALAAPAAAQAATLAVDPVKPCYREQGRVFLTADGYTPNGFVDFSRDGNVIERLQADAMGRIQGNLRLPGLIMGQRTLTYVGTDVSNPAITAQVSLVTTATDVRVSPENGAPNRLLTIRARGFFRGRTLYAHIRRRGKPPRGRPVRVRTVRLGRLTGSCHRAQLRKRLFTRNTAAGTYRVQFDNFRTYKPRRAVQYDRLSVTIVSRASAR